MYQDHSAPIPGDEDPAETVGYRDGRRVVRGEASSKVLAPVDVPEDSVLRGGDQILAGHDIFRAGDRLLFTPKSEVSAREVLASCDHSQFGNVTRKEGEAWVTSCSGCRATIQLARYSEDDVPLDVPAKLRAALDRQDRMTEAQAGLRAWNEEAEDYLAQENPPLPQVTLMGRPIVEDPSVPVGQGRDAFHFAGIPVVVDETLAGDQIVFRTGTPEIRLSDDVREDAHEKALVAVDEVLDSETEYGPGAIAAAATDAVLKVVLDALNGGRR